MSGHKGDDLLKELLKEKIKNNVMVNIFNMVHKGKIKTSKTAKTAKIVEDSLTLDTGVHILCLKEISIRFMSEKHGGVVRYGKKLTHTHIAADSPSSLPDIK